MACEEIVVHGDASLGAAGQNEPKPTRTMKAFYTEVSEQRRTIPVAVAIGMLDRKKKVFKVTTANPQGTHYLLEEDLEAFKQEATIQSLKTLSEAGDLLTISANDLRLKHGFASHIAKDRRDLATKLSVPLSRLDSNVAPDGEWRSVRVDLVGPINRTAVERVMRMIDDQVLAEKNFFCFWIDSPGGDVEQAIRLAGHISRLNPAEVRTVAYVESQALGDASLVALACQELVMGSDAKLGGPGASNAPKKLLDSIRPPLKEICKDQSTRWSLPLALVDPRAEVFRYTLKGAQVEEYLTTDELQELPQPDRWEQGEVLSPAGELLQLASGEAESFGLSSGTVKNYSEFKQSFDLQNDPTLVAPSWADDFIDDLAQPHVAGTLLFFAFFALMVELTSPGLGAGGFISALFFGVYFWSQYLHGTAGTLELVLFGLGVLFVVVEIFVLPGFGLFGIGGAGLIIASLVLASQTFVLPQNEYQAEQLPKSLLTVIAGFSGIFVGLFVLRKFLSRAPVLNRMMLSPPNEERRDEIAKRESLVDFGGLMGEVGIATTKLTPAGKAKFGTRFVDVVTEGQAVDKGGSIEVVEVQGNRIVVQPAKKNHGRQR